MSAATKFPEMGDSLGAWRARIGVFCLHLRTVKVWNPGCASGFKMCFFLAFLLLIGGVEPNPGPTTLEDVYKLMQESKEKMESSFKEVNEKIDSIEKGLKDRIENQEKKITKLEEENVRLKESIKTLEEKQDDLENRSRRNNLIFYGIEDRQANESWAESSTKIISIIRDVMKIEDISCRDIERAHRLGSRAGQRPIIVKFAHFGVRERVISARVSLKGSNIFIGEDYSRRVREEREVLISEMKAARERGCTATVTFNKLKVDGKIFKYSWDEDRIVEISSGAQQTQRADRGETGVQEKPKMVTRLEKRTREEQQTQTPAKGSGSMDGWLQRTDNGSRATRGRGGMRGGRGGR